MLNLSNLPINSIILAPTHLHAFLNQKVLSQSNGKIGLRFYSIASYLQSQSLNDLPSTEAILFTYRDKIKELSTSLSIYKEAALTPAFLKQCYQFIQDLKIWNISPQSLLEDTASNKELKKIILTLYPIHTTGNILHLNEVLLQHKSATHIYIYPSLFSCEEKKWVDLLLSNGAHMLDDTMENKSSNFYHALNKRQEIEGCAQYIIEHQLDAEDVAITIADATYTPIIKQIFQRYEIPFCDLTHNNKSSIALQRFNILLSYFLFCDYDHLLPCLDCGIFHVDHLTSLQKYLQIYQKDIIQPFHHLQEIKHTSHVLDENDLKKLIDLEIEAEAARTQIVPLLHPIAQPKSFESLFLTVLQYVFDSVQNNYQEQSVLIQVQSLLQEILPLIQTNTDLQFLLTILNDFHISSSLSSIQGATISTLSQGQLTKTHHFILGATQNNYPAFPIKSGIFNETYYQSIPYPTMEKRYQQHLQQLQQYIFRCNHLYISYPLGTYEGKSLEPALEIEQIFNHPSIVYPLQESYESNIQKPYLSNAIASELFVKDHTIKGSISSLERYIRCPFSYFLRYGLGLKEPMKLGFSDSYMGTLAHYLLETLTSTYGKQYTKAPIQKIDDLIQTEIQALQEVFPDMHDHLLTMQTRIKESILQTLSRLQEFEEHSQFQPYLQEKEFYYNFPINDDVSFSLHGFIDRIDKYQDILCILDYKSSAKSLSETNVLAALQLQLLTYSIVTRHLENKDIMGAYYISLKNENITHSAGKITRRKPITYTETGPDELNTLLYNTHRLNGWSMINKLSVLDDQGTHITGIRCNKDEEIVTSKLYNLDTLEIYFHEIYQIIGNRILNGDIAIEPSEHACDYCAYHEICRFHGLPFERKPLIEKDNAIYWKGEN